MNKTMKIVIVIALIAAVGIVFAFKQQEKQSAQELSVQVNVDTANDEKVSVQVNVDSSVKVPAGLPRMVDLGAGKCVPCKMMAPILEELKKEYEGRLNVVFIDVWEKPEEATKYKINMIPTQIFYDASGKELFRHEGFFAKEDILGKWKELGIELTAKGK